MTEFAVPFLSRSPAGSWALSYSGEQKIKERADLIVNWVFTRLYLAKPQQKAHNGASCSFDDRSGASLRGTSGQYRNA